MAKKQAEKSQEEVLRRSTPQQGLTGTQIREKQEAAVEVNAQAESLDTPDERTYADKQNLNLDVTKEAREAEVEAKATTNKRESENGLYGNTQMISSIEVEEPEVLGYNPVTLRDRLTVRNEEEVQAQAEKTQTVNESQKKAGVQAKSEEAETKED